MQIFVFMVRRGSRRFNLTNHNQALFKQQMIANSDVKHYLRAFKFKHKSCFWLIGYNAITFMIQSSACRFAFRYSRLNVKFFGR